MVGVNPTILLDHEGRREKVMVLYRIIIPIYLNKTNDIHAVADLINLLSFAFSDWCQQYSMQIIFTAF